MPWMRHPGLYACSLLLYLGLCLPGAAAPAADLDQQRQQFREARQALHTGDLDRYRKLAASLHDYPLYPYLVYEYLRPRLWKAGDSEVTDFLNKYGDLPMAGELRASWLTLLAKRRHWRTFLANYTPQDDPELQCDQLLARIRTGRDAHLLEDTRDLWLVGTSRPPQCDPAFKRLYHSDLMTPELAWRRIHLAMERGKTHLAAYLGQRLLDAHGQRWVRHWIAMYHHPERVLHRQHWHDGIHAREILAYGIRRLARRDIDTAISDWQKLRRDYPFSADQRRAMRRTLAAYAVINGNDQATALLDGFASDNVDASLFQWRLRQALQTHDWEALSRWTQGNPPDGVYPLRWQYWRARALEKTGRDREATALYRSLAQQRDYYGFLAADRLGVNYNLNYLSLPHDAQTWHKIMTMPAVIRARELYMLDMMYKARSEWHAALSRMSHHQMQVAARIAADWGWYDRSILTLGLAQAYDDLILRFPLPYEQRLKEYAAKRGLDLSWVLALTRAESAFMEDARSPTGALGLMQVMPGTGRRTARTLGIKRFHARYLLQPDKNIPIGTAYLKQMYDRFDGNKILATAAYNAGPNNVDRWLPDSRCDEPDVWIETIPYTETRKYVTRILYYSTIYDWRLQRGIKPVHDRMALIEPQKKNLISDRNCVVTNISNN